MESDSTMDTSDQSNENATSVKNIVKKLAKAVRVITKWRRARNSQIEEIQSENNESSTILEPFEIDPNLNLFEGPKENAYMFNPSTIFVIEPSFDHIGTKLRFIKPIGHGAFSLVWLAYDSNMMIFKAIKVFRYNCCINQKEIKILQEFKNHPHIVKLYEVFRWFICGKKFPCIVYELLGKDLKMLIDEASENGDYFSMAVIKKVAKHVLLALEALHKFEIDGKKIIHSDIKPQNIAVCISQRNIFNQLDKIVKSRKSLQPLRMSCRQNFSFKPISEDETWERLSYCTVVIPKEEKFNGLTFKLIDFGNVMKEGERRITGTYGYKPPEYYFGAPLSYSYDIWALGITLLYMLTCQRFIPLPKAIFCWNRNEMKILKQLFGKFPRDMYINCKFPSGYEKKYTEEGLNHEDVEIQFRMILQEKIESYQMYDQMCKHERQKLLRFLSRMIHFNPRRKTAEYLLAHPWLNNVI